MERMTARRKSPKIRRRKRRSKVAVEPIQMEGEEEATFFQTILSPKQVYHQLQESTSRIHRAADRFLDAAEVMLASKITVAELFADQGHPASNEIKDAIDEGLSALNTCYQSYLCQPPGSHKLDLKPLGLQTKTLLMAFLALPPLPVNFLEVASFCGIVAQQFRGNRLVSSNDHAVALFHNVVRYLDQDRDMLDALCQPMEIMFASRPLLLRELISSSTDVVAQIKACRGTRMYKLLLVANHKY
jgi:hypothetical protein